MKLTCSAFLALACVANSLHGAPLKTQNLFLIVSDGLRWQEVFNGAEEPLLSKTLGGVHDTNALRAAFWRDTPEARRQALFPFLWGTIARQGQIFGNQAKGSVVIMTNGLNFSYPGYNEILTGLAGSRIDSNDKKPNPNVNVFEWLNTRRNFRGKVVVFATWDVFPYIFNCERSGLPIWPSWEPRFTHNEAAAPPLLNELLNDTTPIVEGVAYDAFLFHAVMEYVARKKPRLGFIGFGETDEWPHATRYDQYLTAAHHVDRFVQRLWETIQSMSRYRGKTTLIIIADHGRGRGPSEWKDHGEKVVGSESSWIAAIGPDTPPLGERFNTPLVTISQMAATIAAFLGEDYCAAFPRAAKPVADILGASRP